MLELPVRVDYTWTSLLSYSRSMAASTTDYVAVSFSCFARSCSIPNSTLLVSTSVTEVYPTLIMAAI